MTFYFPDITPLLEFTFSICATLAIICISFRTITLFLLIILESKRNIFEIDISDWILIYSEDVKPQNQTLKRITNFTLKLGLWSFGMAIFFKVISLWVN
jgi:hypothetical protein